MRNLLPNEIKTSRTLRYQLFHIQAQSLEIIQLRHNFINKYNTSIKLDLLKNIQWQSCRKLVSENLNMEFHSNLAILFMILGSCSQTLVAVILLKYNKSLPWRSKNVISYLNRLLIYTICLLPNCQVNPIILFELGKLWKAF